MSNITLVIIPVWLVSHHPPWCYIFVVVVVILLSVDIFLFFILCRVNRFTLYFLCWEGYILRSKGKKKQHTHKNTGSPSAPRDPLHSCFSHQRLPDKWVHQGEHWDVVSRMGHVARARGGDTFSRLRISMHARVRARACAIWLCANVSFCLFMGCDNVDGCHCHLWLPPQQMGSGSDRRRKVSEISPLDRRRGGGRRALYTKLTICLDKTQEVAYIVPTSNLNSNIGWLVDQTFRYWGEWSKCHSVQPGGNDYTHHW